MKQYKIQFSLKNHVSNMQTIVAANSTTEAKKIVQSQHGSNLRSINVVGEVK